MRTHQVTKIVQRAAAVAGGIALLQAFAVAAPFQYQSSDLIAAFRKPGAGADLVVDIGKASLYDNLAPGTTFIVTNVSAGQLNGIFSSVGGITWSISGAIRVADPNFPQQTIWASAARADIAAQSVAWRRQGVFTLGGAASQIDGVGNAAVAYSGSVPADALTNTVVSVAIPSGDDSAYSAFISATGDFGGAFQGNIENTTVAGVSARSDLYEIIPGAGSTLNSPSALVGYFDLGSDGTLSFTAAAHNPILASQPADRTVGAGTNVVFSASAWGPPPASYQWTKDGTTALSDGGGISGAATASLTVNASDASAGTYAVTIANNSGNTTTRGALLTVIDPPVISVPPAGLTIGLGSNATFSVVAAGAAPSYQWSYNGAPINNATDSSFTVAGAAFANAGAYTVTLTNSAGSTTSAPATLAVISAPQITVQPAPAAQTVPQGTNVSYSAAASGVSLSYQWTLNGAAISGATDSSYSISSVQSANLGAYSVSISNAAGAVVSANAVLAIIPDSVAPTIKVGTIPKTVTSASLVVTGTATDNVRVKQVLYALNAPAFQAAAIQSGAKGITNWTANITLVPGANTLVFKSRDLAGNDSAPVSVSVFYSVHSPIILSIAGSGALATNWTGLPELGKGYTITATPATGFIFSNWTGSVTGTGSKLNFVSQPGTAITANFIPNPLLSSPSYNGLVLESGNVAAHPSAGFITLKATPSFGFSGKLLLNGDSLSISGTLAIDGTYSGTLARNGKSPLAIRLALDFSGSDRLTGTISNTDWSANILGDRAVFSKTAPATAYTNTYTFLLPGFTNADATVSGFGYGSVAVAADGTISLAGALADGTAISQTVAVSKNGYWPLYVSLYGGKGEIVGWLNFAGASAPAGQVSWIKTTTGSGINPNGLTNVSDVIGSVYTPPASGQRILTFQRWPFGLISFFGGNLTDELWDGFTLSANNAAATWGGSKLTFTTKSGLFKGSFSNPVTSTNVSFAGVVIQNQNFGGGSFLGATQSGGVLVQPFNP